MASIIDMKSNVCSKQVITVISASLHHAFDMNSSDLLDGPLSFLGV